MSFNVDADSAAILSCACPIVVTDQRELCSTCQLSYQQDIESLLDEEDLEYEDEDEYDLEYEEWQDYYGGDDWDQGQYDEY